MLAETKSAASASDNPRAKKTHARLQFGWDLASADASGRHKLIRSLPVTIIKKNGIREFVSRGKVRSRLVPAADSGSDFPGAPVSFEQPDGASPAVATILASAQCEFEGQPDTCATALEQEDALIYLAYLDAEMEGVDEDISEASSVYDTYCNTWGCEDQSIDVPVSGPSATDDPSAAAGCGRSWTGLALSSAGWAFARYALYTAATAITISTGGLAVIVAGAAVATMSVAWSAGDVITCVYGLPIFTAPEAWELDELY